MVTGLVTFALRRPEAFIRPEFLGEEAGVFWAATAVLHRLDALLTPWNGFVYVVPRAVFEVASIWPATIAPAVVLGIFGVQLGVIALFLASDRMVDALPDPRARLVAGVAVFLLPFASGVYSSSLQIQWWMAIYLTALLVTRPPRTRGAAWADRIGAALTALTGPATIVLAPAFFVRRRLDIAVITTAGAVIQVAAYAGSPRVPSDEINLFQLPLVLLERLGTIPLGDELGDAVMRGDLALPAALVGLGAFAIAAWSLPRPTLLAFGYIALALPAMGMIAGATEDFRQGIFGARYFVPAAWLAWVAFGMAFSARPRTSVVLFALLAAGLVSGWRGWPNEDTHWAAYAGCIGGRAVCTVPIDPHVWDVHWVPGSYRVPAAAARDGTPIYGP